MLKLFSIIISFSFICNAITVDFDRGYVKLNNINTLKVPSPKISKTDEKKEWTIMVFMNGKNNLAKYVLKDINEMEMYGSPLNVNIVVEAGRINYTPPSYPHYPGYPDIYPYDPTQPHPHWPPLPPYLKRGDKGKVKGISSFTGVKRFLIKKDSDINVINSPVIETLDRADMGDPNHLVDFVLWAKKKFPAKKYMLIIWNHGSGWKTKNIFPDIIKGISSDDETGNEISTVELGQAIKRMGKIDIYASDACLMQMIEVVYELRNTPSIIIGSEETEPGDGWAYDYFLKNLINSRDLAPETVAKAAVSAYGEYYGKRGDGTTQSAVRTNKIDTLRYMIDLWVQEVMRTGDKDKIKESIKKSLGFEGSGSRDLVDLIKIVSYDLQNQNLINKADEIERFVKRELVIENSTTGDSYKKANGIGIYVPIYMYDTKYDNLEFSKKSLWDDFLKWLYKD